MAVVQDLSAIWEHIVRAGQIRNKFTGLNGEQFESGIRMTPDGPQHYVINVETNREVGLGVLERPLEGSDFLLQLNPYRSLKPHVRALGLGRQRDYSPGVADCSLPARIPQMP